MVASLSCNALHVCHMEINFSLTSLLFLINVLRTRKKKRKKKPQRKRRKKKKKMKKNLRW